MGDIHLVLIAFLIQWKRGNCDIFCFDSSGILKVCYTFVTETQHTLYTFFIEYTYIYRFKCVWFVLVVFYISKLIDYFS